MSTSNNASGDENTYFIDAENAAEMARLLMQDRLLTKTMGGLFPQQIDLADVQRILDLACGPGGWVLDVARTYPGKQVVGVDVSQLMVAYASMQAREQKLPNASFQIMDILKPLAFPDNSFDLVNARFLTGLMPTGAWPELVQECMRILRPGGIIRLTEFEATISNSPSAEKLFALSTRAIQMTGQAFSPGNNIGTTAMLGPLLRNAGYEQVQYQAYALDSSAGVEAHHSQFQNAMTFFKLLQPFLVKLGITTQEEVEILYQRAMKEMMSTSYCAIMFILSAWGTKPA
jgi:ubiquinone/menaquinone biosynthesis C-methylase UbiE